MRALMTRKIMRSRDAQSNTFDLLQKLFVINKIVPEPVRHTKEI